MPAAATAAPRINPFHRANRLTAVIDMANFLIAHHAPVGDYASVIDATLSFACTMTDAQWVELGERTGHYLTAGTEPADETIADVLRHLEAMLPAAADESDPFAGLGF